MKQEKVFLKFIKFRISFRIRIGSFENVQLLIDIPGDPPDAILDIVTTGIHDLSGQSVPTPGDPQFHPITDLFWTTAGWEGRKVKLIASLNNEIGSERDYQGNLTILILHK